MRSRLSTTGERPPPCAGFTLTEIDDRRAVLFGGVKGHERKLNDVYIIDTHLKVVYLYYVLFPVSHIVIVYYMYILLHPVCRGV